MNPFWWTPPTKYDIKTSTAPGLDCWCLTNWCCKNWVTLWQTSFGMWFRAKKRRKRRNCVASSSLKDLKPAIRLLMVLMSVALVIRDLKAITQFKSISVVFVGCKGLSPTPSWQNDHSIHIKYLWGHSFSSIPLFSTQLLPGCNHRIPYQAQAIQWFNISNCPRLVKNPR